MKVELDVKGMTCASCVGRIEKQLNKIEGIENVTVSLATEKAHFDIGDKQLINVAAETIAKAGYEVPINEFAFAIEGMTCASCVDRIEKVISKLSGVKSVTVNLATEQAKVTALSGTITYEDLFKAVSKAGYHAVRLGGNLDSDQEKIKEKELQREKEKVLLAAILSTPLILPMILAPFGISMMIPGWFQLVLATPVQFYLGARFYTAAWKAIKARAGNMDLLVALGTTAAFGLSIYLLLKHTEHNVAAHLYFESSAVVITLVLLGKFLEARAKRQTSSAIKALQTLRPETARVLKDGKEVNLSISDVLLRDIVIVLPGEKIPVDGLIKNGESHVDESLLSGESLPVSKTINDKVIGGSINGEGRLIVETTALGGETTLARIIRLVENAQAAKAPIQRLVDKVSAIFVPVVLVISLFTILGWGIFSGNWEQAIINGVAVLVIACPCALGLATPTSIMVGTGLGAKAGILIKDAEALEIAHSVTLVAFDKTGTLTEGKPQLVYSFTNGITERELLSLTSSIQKGSEHPLAKATLIKTQNLGIEIVDAQDVKAISGKGVEGNVSGKKIFIGTKRLMSELGLDSVILESKMTELQQSGHTVSFVSTEKEILGVLAFRDQVKKEAKETIHKLKELKIKSVMLTGDNEGAANAVASELGIDEFRAHVLPQDKSKIVEEYKLKNETVAMVGDGINDAPALASAHVGIAMSTGTDVAMHTAGITLMRGNPLLIPDAIEISRLTYKKIKQNLFWAFIYNVIGIPLAAGGLLSPVVAGAAMAMSSVSVVTNALMLRKWKPSSK